MQPETRYADSGGVNIAYQVLGNGPRDLVFVMGFVSNIEVFWEDPTLVRFLTRLASFSRVILFDKRGTGLSDRVADMPSLEVPMDDVRAVMNAVASERATLFGVSEGGPMCALFSATYPSRVSALVMSGSFPLRIKAPDYPWGPTKESARRGTSRCDANGADRSALLRAPSMMGDERFSRWWARLLRMSASPAAATSLVRMNKEIDIRYILSAIRVPTLLLHSVREAALPIDGSRYMAERIPGARLVELPGEDHLPWLSDSDAILGEIEEFLTGVRHADEPDRILATVLFTDVVGATEKAAALGDRRWRDLLDGHNEVVRRELARFRGREIKTTGDGFFAAFDGPARAVRCACAVSQGMESHGLEVRAGLHKGECELIGDDMGGIAVPIGARIAALAAPGEVLVSSTVKDLVAGSGLRFSDHKMAVLKGVPGEWRLYSVR
jgi:pimeloyl-ACP methyl ester carboxylesterase